MNFRYGIDIGNDAILAGTDRFSECILYIHDNLYITEDRQTATDGFIHIDPNKWIDIPDFYDRDIVRIKSMLYLRQGRDYSLLENYNELRYGYIKIHCTDLNVRNNVLGWFQQNYPSIVQYIINGGQNVIDPNIVLED